MTTETETKTRRKSRYFPNTPEAPPADTVAPEEAPAAVDMPPVVAAAPAIPPVATAPFDNRLDRLLTLTEGLVDRVAALEGRSDQPKFVPMKHDTSPSVAGTYEPPEAIARRAAKGLKKDGDQVVGRVGLFNNPEYLKKIPPQNRPVFKSGDRVGLNPDSPIWGGNGKLWREVLEKLHIDGLGEVMSVQYMTKSWEPKYTVLIPGLTRKDGDGFRESELLPA